MCFFILRMRLRVHQAPGFPCALFFGRDNVHASLGRFPRRGNELLCAVSASSFETALI